MTEKRMPQINFPKTKFKETTFKFYQFKITLPLNCVAIRTRFLTSKKSGFKTYIITEAAQMQVET